ncbi:MAG: type II toxin-antitoxin system VapC family toxin [Cellvibrionaceae bacterium]|nr:type II toxin-antitoxin system VapC family toxin [Cellvibrionaceae bacterium]
MIGLDTNVLIRYITQDDAIQAKKATLLIENELTERNLGFVTLIALIELSWVLGSCYEQNKVSIIRVVEALLTTKQIMIERADLAHLALKDYQAANGDFSDALISRISIDNGCSKILTFDKKAQSVGMNKI